VTKGGVKETFVCSAPQHKAFEDKKSRLFSAPVLILSYLQWPFDIEIYSFGSVLNQHGHLVSHHIETLSDVVQRYPTYDKEMYSIM
jgi:hypothetical protein